VKLDRWRTLLDSSGPFASITLDTSRSDESGGNEVRLRWEAVRRDLAEHGATDEVLDAMEKAVLEPTGRAGQAGRFVVASAGEPGVKVLLDEVLPMAPSTEQPVWGPAPHLLPGVRATCTSVPYFLVKIDRAGADVEIHGAPDERVETETVEGDHDVLHKVPGGGWAHLRQQKRVEDSLERNATEVAQAVARLHRRFHPALVLLAGDVRAVGAFLEHAPSEVASITVQLDSGGRADGVKEEAMEAAVQAALDDYRRATQRKLIERYQEGEGREDNAVQGLPDVVDALRRSQVEEILLRDDPSSTLHLWVGEQPLLIGMTEAEVRSIGAEHPQRVRADAALAWAALGSDAALTLLDEELLGAEVPHLEDGIAAVLRWSDRSTPKESLPSMPGHGEPRGGEPVA
jgi:release factor family 2